MRLLFIRAEAPFESRMIWYEEEVLRVEKEAGKLVYQPETIFYGSSSFTLWDTLYSDFEDLKPVNLGFGGSTLAACSWFFDRIMAQLGHAKTMLIYAGDNDLGDGRNAMEVCIFYRELIAQIRSRFGAIPCYYISIKPSIQRWELLAEIKATNQLIREETEKDQFQHFVDIFPAMLGTDGRPVKSFFEADGLHLSPAGYAVWEKEIRNAFRLTDHK
ncbi:GDSL-type esterase/lipase family protein [Dyadobacter crusticola]|uniref:GDSL-type esterase/lipase family protein n=1 Tax=Dyadobacter crusticola TaxID=292407 RepID=UPI000ABE2164|nr:GDSL-type esterase/lipase family protein [Dyadobacter crusticola]